MVVMIMHKAKPSFNSIEFELSSSLNIIQIIPRIQTS